MTLLDAPVRDASETSREVWIAPMLARGVNAKDREVTALVSTPTVARDGMVIRGDAFDASIPNFLRNPVLCASHRYELEDGSPAVIGHWRSLAKAGDGLEGTCRFMTGDSLADKYWARYEQHAMRAFSVRWITQASERGRASGADGKQTDVRVLTRCDLLEISAVAVPCDPLAVARGLQAAGVKTLNDLSPADLQSLRDSLRGIVAEAVARALNTDPGAPLCELIRDVVESSRGALGHVLTDDTAAPGSEPETTSEDVARAQSLKDLMQLAKQLAG